ncbi:MAG: hypothetical protein K2X81_19640 [Candidatus Obscuribacterales bacterium]|nr:hypothetical protein [Candidatus Obscuribacterales bacterium]
MYKHPMLSVKEAAAALGCDERWVRERLNQGQLKGEKKNIGAKEKWFVYKGEIDAALARKGVFPSPPTEQENLAPPQGPTAPQPQVANQIYYTTPGQPIGQPTQPVDQLNTIPHQGQYVQQPQVAYQTYFAPAEQHPIHSTPPVEQQRTQEPQPRFDSANNQPSNPFREIDKPAASTVIEGEARAVDEGDSKTVLSKEEETIKRFADMLIKPLVETIQKQTSALDAKELIIQDQKKQLLLLPDLEAKKRELENRIEGERKAAQLNYDRALELEKQLEDERKAQEAEVQRIKTEKEAEAKAVQEQLAQLTNKLEKLEQPWWKRMFSSGES